jgi:hypothetical protein
VFGLDINSSQIYESVAAELIIMRKFLYIYIVFELLHIPHIEGVTESPPPPPGATQPIVGMYIAVLYRALASSRKRLLDHIQRRATFCRIPLNE